VQFSHHAQGKRGERDLKPANGLMRKKPILHRPRIGKKAAGGILGTADGRGQPVNAAAKGVLVLSVCRGRQERGEKSLGGEHLCLFEKTRNSSVEGEGRIKKSSSSGWPSNGQSRGMENYPAAMDHAL